MKKLILLFTLASALLSGCSKGEDPYTDEQIVGTWWAHTALDPNIIDPETKKPEWIDVSGIADYLWSTFNPDGSYQAMIATVPYSGTWTREGNSIICQTPGKTIHYRITSMIGNEIEHTLAYNNDKVALYVKATKQ